MKNIIATLGLVGLTACSNTAIDYADAGSTAIGISQGLTEMNPVIGVAGDAAAPVVSLVVKAGVREFMLSQGYTLCEANRVVGAGSALGLGNNIAVLAGASNPVGLAVGAVSAVVYHQQQQCVVIYWDVILDPETGEIEYVEGSERRASR